MSIEELTPDGTFECSALCGITIKKKNANTEEKEKVRTQVHNHEKHCLKCKSIRAFNRKHGDKYEEKGDIQMEEKIRKEETPQQSGPVVTGLAKEQGIQIPSAQEPEQEVYDAPAPNKVSIQYGNIGIAIESIDESTEGICNIGMQMIAHLLGGEQPPAPEPTETASPAESVSTESTDDPNADLGGQKQFETLMESIK